MKQLAIAGLLLAATAFAHGSAPHIAHDHVCVHNTPAIQRAFAAAKPIKTEGKAFHGASKQQIRVAVDYKNLQTSAKRCETQGETKPVMDSSNPGTTATCQSWGLYKAGMDTVIIDNIMSAAKTAIQEALKVEPLSTMAFAPDECGPNIDLSGAPSPITGVDFQIYVTMGALASSYENTLAYAYPCATDVSGRAIMAVVNFNPKYLYTTWGAFSAFEKDDIVVTAVHEILHGLGFNSGNINSLSTTVTRREKSVKLITSPNVARVSEEFFGCNRSAEIEDEGGSGTAGAHWERRVLPAEMMAGMGGRALTKFTLAFLADLGYYEVNYGVAKEVSTGRGAGCDFVDYKCNTAEGGKDTVWSFNSKPRCSPDFFFVGQSSWADQQSAVPSYFQYDAANPNQGGGSNLADQCPLPARYSEAYYQCAFGDDTTNADTGVTLGPHARCFETSGTTPSGDMSLDQRCFRARCPFAGSRIEFAIGTKWVACPLDGSARKGMSVPSPFSGTVDCPSAAHFCQKQVNVGSSAREELPTTDSELPMANGAATFTFAVVLNGTFTALLTESATRTDLNNRLRVDMANFLKIPSRNIRLRRSTVLDGGLDVIVGIIATADGTLSSEAVDIALSGAIEHRTHFLTLTSQLYSEKNAEPNQRTTVQSYRVDKPESSSVCSGSITPEDCLIIISICASCGFLVILLIVVYCLCLSSPFSDPPAIPGAKKAGGKGDAYKY